MLFGLLSQFFSVGAQKNDFEEYPVYNGNDLGVSYSKSSSVFKLWSPIAQKTNLFLYHKSQHPIEKIEMKKGENGIWETAVNKDLKNFEYTFSVMIDSVWQGEAVDPYAKAAARNGKRGVVVDLSETNPSGWANEKSPEFKNPTDAIIYELHVRDVSSNKNSGIKNKGKFLGLIEKGTKNTDRLSTGLDHFKELGVTHIHILPMYDFSSIDEINIDGKYNWGYDPLNYNLPEGSYSTNPLDAVSRIKELKQMIKTLHENGLRVVMDVVYNHTALTKNSNFNELVPGYYYRQKEDGTFSDASACGNETASERKMMQKFILESVLYWVNEYHIDGFRFDLMGIHDIETMNLISKELHKIKPDILLYGEGWTAGKSPLPDSLRALKANVDKLDRIAVFSDDIRDGIKGSVFEHEDNGFVSGKPGMEESIKFGIVAATKHPQVDYSKVNYSKAPYANEPYQTITYAECHDNHVLWDKLAISAKNASEDERKEMHKLALSIVLTSQGISFLHAGTEFLRSKKGVENSYESPDSINAIDWNLKSQNRDVFEYVKSLIEIRKEHPAFRMISNQLIRENLEFNEKLANGVVGYKLNGFATNDTWKKIMVFFNGSNKKQTVEIYGIWNEAIKSNKIMTDIKVVSESVELKPFSCTILYQQ